MLVIVVSVVTTSKLVELYLGRSKMNLRHSQRTQESPCHWHQVLLVQLLRLLQHHRWIEVKDFKQDHCGRLEEVSHLDIDDEIFVPVCCLLSLHSEVIHLGAHRNVVINHIVEVLLV